MSRFALLFALLLGASLVQAEIKTSEIPYKGPDGTSLVGYYAYDDAVVGKRPGVIVVHEWWGLNDYAKRRARDLAALGYSALAIDMYGDGKNTEHPADAQAFMQAALASAPAAKARFLTGLDLLKAQPQTDPDKLAAIGYCFGGKVVLDMAREGVPLAAVVSFHGVLAATSAAKPGAVKAKVLVEHGENDTLVPMASVTTFKEEFDNAKADYRVVIQPKAKHSFTNPDADRLSHAGHGSEKGPDLGYNEVADENSWADMQALFKETLGQ
ncbi:dienelactone hydrolase family protein [Pseudomonas sp. JS3066]|uniref:dienelactone hydrolase family protein n=1 Tax=unclassified Pseudomonas TaxID=196821 RepID=UPI00129E7CF2|nr:MULTISPECIES: dienelactone hydrolase family protein [unclassified Pseudomonas]MDH4652322.1 dienelactone hydrolase family protein [Pseudomonas sp. BN606]MRK24332.1 dienelactone hydrolase family protein [Pseudomonas sp. JG-B]WVK95600.1 dienelactone hydrolase family protein [Pseudomonas sp. JS3066]